MFQLAQLSNMIQLILQEFKLQMILLVQFYNMLRVMRKW